MRIALLTSTEVTWPLQLARTWAAAGDHVTLVLLDAASAAARPGHADAHDLSGSTGDGVVVLVDEAALRRRGIPAADLTEGVKPTDLDAVADLVGDSSDRVVWL